MEHGIDFLQDLAVVMVVAALTTVLFHRLKQPVVLGYMLAGVIIGPYTPPFPLIKSEHTIRTLAELGIVFLMFRMGLHFSLRKLFRIGSAALLAATFEISLMLALGFQIGRWFGWSTMDSLFLGAMLSISSTTIIVKTLTDLRMIQQSWVDLIFAILIGEDLVAVAILAVLPALAHSGELPVADVLLVIAQLAVFLAVVLVIGLICIPRILKYVAKYKEDEMLLVTVLGLCFAVTLLAANLGYSIALGSFLVGAIMAETRQAGRIEHVIAPIRDMFSAVFFVAVGMLIQPDLLLTHAIPIIIISLTVIFGKILACSAGALLAGNDTPTSLRVGMGLAQIGEFSFIIAQMGIGLGVTGKFLYSIIVTVSAITAFTTPYLIKHSEQLAGFLHNRAPVRLTRLLTFYRSFLDRFRQVDAQKDQKRAMLKKAGLQIVLNILLLTGFFVVAAWLQRKALTQKWINQDWVANGIIWIAAILFSLPIIIGTLRKIKKVAELMVERVYGPASEQRAFTNILAEGLIFFIGVVCLMSWIIILSLTILPQWHIVLILLAVTSLISLMMWRPLLGVYEKGKDSLHETLTSDVSAEKTRSDILSSVLHDAVLDKVTILEDSHSVGQLIRELHLRSRVGVTAVGIERKSGGVINPGPDEEVLAGDILLLLGDSDQIARAKEYLNRIEEKS